MKKFLAAAVCVLGFAGSAQADFIPATWTDTKTFTVNEGYIGAGGSLPYKHILTDDGFTPLADLITDFYLTINLADDADTTSETAFIDLAGWLGDSYVYNFGLSGAEYGGWSIVGLLELNLLGSLSVTVQSVRGDFVLQSSQLVANGFAKNVPEPGALGLLGIGLLGMALSMRRRKSAPLG